MRFVSLSTDHAPTYAAWAPVAARFWLRLGYRAIVHVENGGWASAFGEFVLGELAKLGAILIRVDRAAPLSVGDTMRVARLCAAGSELLDPDDFVLMADVDMLPFDEAFFANRGGLVSLRALAYRWAKLPFDQTVPTVGSAPWRLPMCYAGASVRAWRAMLPMSVAAILETKIPHRGFNLDEMVLSHALFAATGDAPIESVADGAWRKGDLLLVDPIRAPHPSAHRKTQRGMLDSWSDAAARRSRVAGMIDFVPARFYLEHRPVDDLDVATVYVPEEKAWLDDYRARLCEALDVGGPALWS